MCVVSSLFALTALLRNFIVMLVIWKMRELHTPSFALLFCLAVSDFLVGLVGQPSFVAYKVAELLEDFNGYCKVQMIQFFTGWITSGVSLLTLSGVCVDRLLALTLHLQQFGCFASLLPSSGFGFEIGSFCLLLYLCWPLE